MSVVVSFRRVDGRVEDDRVWGEVASDVLKSAVPWRTFRWHKGQKHYSGFFWSSTERDHVIYESRLELARLLFADFDTSVRRIIAQPFLLKCQDAGIERKHIPDYLLFTDRGPRIVDVKPSHRLAKPEVASTFAWTRQAVESRGWQYEVWTEPCRVELGNLRFLAGYRRDWLFPGQLLDALRKVDLDGATLERAFQSLPGQPRVLVRAAVLHLLWKQHFTVDLSQPLMRANLLRRSS